ncbi:MAG: DUF6020 family protein [Ignavibacteriales bacterium]
MTNIKNNKYFRIFILLLLSIITTLSFFLDVNMIGKSNPLAILKGRSFTIFVVSILIYQFYNKYYFKNIKSKLSFKILSLLFSLFLVVGNSYEEIGNWNLVMGSISNFLISCVLIFGYYNLILCTINIIFDFINNTKIFNLKIPNKWSKLIFEDHPMLSSILIMLICWLPYIIAFYPAILSPDPSNQIKQFFGLETHYIEGVNLIDENVLITNHHPVLHTALLGGSVKIGRMLGSDNFGLFIYSIIQISILVSVLAFTIKYMKKLNTPYWLRTIVLIIYALVPVFPFYAMSAVKDTIFTSLVILYTIMLFEIINKQNIKIKQIILYTLLLLLIMLFRNNGIYMIILSFPFLFLIEKKNRIKLGIILIIPILLFQGYNKILLPALHITPGSIREILSIPFQQTARYIKYYNHLTKEDIEIVDKLLDYETLASRYNPILSDPVKNQFNKDYTSEDLKNYFKVWFKGFMNRPCIYTEATINNTYGYFYPNTSKWYIYHKYDSRLEETGLFNYHYNSLNGMCKNLSYLGIMYPYFPIVGMIVNIAFCGWMIMTMAIYLLVLNKRKYLIYLLPSLALLLICVASPANTYFRYAMPYIFSIPILIAMFININKKSFEGEVKHEK